MQFVKGYLKLTNTWQERGGVPKTALEHFVGHELKYDGVFVLHFIAMNCGELACAEIVTQMWKMHRKSSAPQLPPPPPDNVSERTNSLNISANGKSGRHGRSSNSSSSPMNNMSEV
jgi:hypothetical protein